MGLFDKRPPCAICGGKVKGLLPWKIEGNYICDDATASLMRRTVMTLRWNSF